MLFKGSNTENEIFVFVSETKKECNTQCSIMQDNISDIEIEGLPTSWRLEKCAYNTATLECSHSFHISAITMHFIHNGMRCPVCRDGLDDKLDVSCIPRPMRQHFESKNEKMQEDSQEPSMELQLDFGRIERDWVLMAEFFTTSPRTATHIHHTLRFVPTPIRRYTEQNSENENMINFGTQSQFTRRLVNVMNRLKPLEDIGGSTDVTFSLYHYWLPQMSFRNSKLSLHNLAAAIDGESFQQVTQLTFGNNATDIQIGHINIWNELLDINTRSPHTNLSLNADFMLQLVLASFQQASVLDENPVLFAIQNAIVDVSNTQSSNASWP